MDKYSSGQRSYNTLKKSQRMQRIRRLQMARILLLTICAVILLLAVTGLVFLFCHIGHSVSGNSSTVGTSGKVVYTKLTCSATDMHTGDLILVNNDHAYTFPETTIEDLTDKTAYDMNTYLSQQADVPYTVKARTGNPEMTCMLPTSAKAMDSLLAQFYQTTSVKLSFYGGYRSYDYQKGLNSSVKAGCSDQHTGLSAWITDGDSTQTLSSDSKAKLIELSKNYGFIQRYPDSKYSETGVSNYTELFRYVGIPHAKYIAKQNLSLESYIKLLQTSYTYSGNHLLIDANGNATTDNPAYEIYYIPMNGDSTTVSVPKNYGYTISGDNVGGFIVTVDLTNPK